jgi:GDP-L-fucose synthase
MSKLFIAGHRGMVGSALLRRFSQSPEWPTIVTASRKELDLTDSNAVHAFFEKERPTHVIIAAAKVGGIHANRTYPFEFLLDNLKIQNNLIEESLRIGVKKLLFLGSSCIYPKFAPQPLHEDSLLTGPLEPTNDAYAIAKIAGIKACQAARQQYGADMICAMPTNLYGPHDNFTLEDSHVLPAFIRKFHDAKEAREASVEVWGTGTPRREFLHVDDLADACYLLMEKYSSPEIVNVGTGEDVTIRELTEIVARVVGYSGTLKWNTDMPDGTPRKLLDVSRIQSLGWKARIPLEEGIRKTYEWFLTSPDVRK